MASLLDRKELYQGGDVDQVAFGKRLHADIKKRLKPSPLEVMSRLAQVGRKGIRDKIKHNFRRIGQDLEEERAGLTTFFNQYNENEISIKTLKELGQGSLITGILRDFQKNGFIPNLSNLNNIEAKLGPDYYKDIMAEVEKKKKILLDKRKEYKTLRSTYNPDKPEEGVVGTEYTTEPLFDKPTREGVRTIGLNQRYLGNNNLWNLMTRKARKTGYDLREDGYALESSLQTIIKASRQARDAIQDYAPSEDMLQYLQDTREAAKTDKDPATKLKEKVAELEQMMSDSKTWADDNGRKEEDHAFYFMPLTDNIGKELRKRYNYSEDLASFVSSYPEYTEKYIKELFYGVQVSAPKLDNENLVRRFNQGDPDIQFGYDDQLALNKARAYEMFNLLSKGTFNINVVPPDKRGYIYSVLKLPGYEEKFIPWDTAMDQEPVVLSQLEKLGGDYVDTYFGLEENIVYVHNVLQDAQRYQKEYNIPLTEAIYHANANQRVGLLTQEDADAGRVKRTFGWNINDEYSRQVYLPLVEGRVHQSILEDYGRDAPVTEEELNLYLRELNFNRVYWYQNAPPKDKDTFTPKITMNLYDPIPVLYEDKQGAIIGPYMLEFNADPQPLDTSDPDSEFEPRWKVIN